MEIKKQYHELLTADIGLLAWTVFSFLSLVLLVIALITLVMNKSLHSTTKLMWTLIIVLVPTIGSILFFSNGRHRKEV